MKDLGSAMTDWIVYNYGFLSSTAGTAGRCLEEGQQMLFVWARSRFSVIVTVDAKVSCPFKTAYPHGQLFVLHRHILQCAGETIERFDEGIMDSSLRSNHWWYCTKYVMVRTCGVFLIIH
jgi:hypothetical protein